MERLQHFFVVIGSVTTSLALVLFIEQEPVPEPSNSVVPTSSVPMVHMHVASKPFKAEARPSTAPPQPKEGPASSPIRNPGIEPQELSHKRLTIAQSFLREVTVLRDPRGGFIVQDIDAGSLYAALGLRPGDRIFSLDTPATEALSDDTIDGAMSQQHVELEVYRSEGFVLLKYEL